VGTWRLVSAEITSGGEVRYPFGEDAAGYIVYNGDGHMSVTIARAGRENFASEDLRGGSAAEKAAAFDSYLTYCGRYEIHGDRVVHYVEACLFPNWVGSEQERFYEFRGGRLILSTPEVLMGGAMVSGEMTWERVSSSVSA
jgi:hypothetical protein